jgi:hypothetical protein
VIETGSHPGNLDRIARAEAEATAVDNVTYTFWWVEVTNGIAGLGGVRARTRTCRAASGR